MRPAGCVLGTLLALGIVFASMCIREYGRWL